MESWLVVGICIWIYYTKTNMSGLRIKKHPAFKPVNYTFDTELNSILYDTEKRSVQLILNESEEVILVVEAEVQVEIE